MISLGDKVAANDPGKRWGVDHKIDESVRKPHLAALRDAGSVHVRRPVYGLASRTCRSACPRGGAFPCDAQWPMPTLRKLAYRCEGSVGFARASAGAPTSRFIPENG
jgi:hypothetical protein